MQKPTKHSVALVIRKDDHILAIRRPADDDELPGIWGLPAGTFRGSERLDDLIARIGEQKLGVKLKPLCRLAEGSQDRPAYTLQMELWEVTIAGEPRHSSWQWAALDVFASGEARGSLCCDLVRGLSWNRKKPR